MAMNPDIITFDATIQEVVGDLAEHWQHQRDHRVLFFPGNPEDTFTYWATGAGLLAEDVVRRWEDFADIFRNGWGGTDIDLVVANIPVNDAVI